MHEPITGVAEPPDIDNNGIIVYNGGDGQFYAYDRTCPHDYEVNNLSIKVKIDFTIAVCPECGTTYALSASGTPASGKGRYPIKELQDNLRREICKSV